jgi:hypothetical protein
VLSHTYGDTDANGFPVGLTNTIDILQAGSGVLTVTLRHLPPQDDAAVKTGTLAEDVAADGIDGLPGATDVSVDFDVTVQ